MANLTLDIYETLLGHLRGQTLTMCGHSAHNTPNRAMFRFADGTRLHVTASAVTLDALRLLVPQRPVLTAARADNGMFTFTAQGAGVTVQASSVEVAYDPRVGQRGGTVFWTLGS